MKTTTRLQVEWICLLFGLLVSITAVESTARPRLDPPAEEAIRDDPFVPREDPLLTYRTVDIEPLRQRDVSIRPSFPSLATTQSVSDSPVSFVTDLSRGRALLGTISLRFQANDIPRTDSVRVRFALRDEGEQTFTRTDVSGSVPTNGEVVEFQLPGHYAESLAIEVTDAVDIATESLEIVESRAIILSDAIRLMPLGDSITEGYGSDDGVGYRKVMHDQLFAAGMNVDFVGPVGDPPYEGHFDGGKRINSFFPRNYLGRGYATGDMDVTYYMDVYRPDLVTIHLGTNGINNMNDLPPAPYDDPNQEGGFAWTVAGDMGALIDYLLKWHHGEKGDELDKVLVSLIIPVQRAELTAQYQYEYIRELARLIRDFQNGVITGTPEPVYWVDHYSRFDEYPYVNWRTGVGWMFDGLHPNSRGHMQIGSIFTERIQELYNGFLPFTDVTWVEQVAGPDPFHNFQGVAVADMDGDGLDDLYSTRYALNEAIEDSLRRDFLYANEPDSTFSERAVDARVSDAGQSRGVVFVDVDNDGDYDLFNAQSGVPNTLYENRGDGTFQDISTEAGISPVAGVTTSVLAFDCEGDGDMDLYCVNSRTENELYINHLVEDGQLLFVKEDRGADDVIESSIPSMSGAAADYDNDGDVDIYIVKRGAENVLFVNDGTGHFHSGAAAAGIDLNQRSDGAVWSDLDNDGFLDLIVAGSRENEDDLQLVHFFHNQGDGTFVDMSQQVQIEMDGYSVLIADFNNDGLIDCIPTFEGDVGGYYQNQGGWQFSPVPSSGVTMRAGDPRGAAVLDYNNDGAMDFYVIRKDAYNILYRNNVSSAENYIKVDAYGPFGNRGGFGTKVWVYAAGQLGEPSGLLGYREVVSASAHQSQSSPVQHVGLGAHGTCDILVRFSDGSCQVLRSVASNQTITVRPGGQNQSSGVPESLAYESGNNQQSEVGSILPDPIRVRVSDAPGAPVKGAEVKFTVLEGDVQIIEPVIDDNAINLEAEGGELAPGMARIADLDASSSTSVWTRASDEDLVIEVPISQSSQYYGWIRAAGWNGPTDLTVQLGSGDPVDISVASRQVYEWIPITATLETPDGVYFERGTHTLTIRAADSALLDKVLLTWDPDQVPVGPGEPGLEPGLTDASGLTGRRVQLGTNAGPVLMQARLMVDGTPVPGQTVDFNADALPGPPVQLTGSNNNQVGEIGVPLDPFVLHLEDVFGNPTPSVPVLFELLSGGGSIEPAGEVRTDTSGRASTVLTPGESSSTQQVQASVEGVADSPFLFTAYIAGVADSIQAVSGNGQQATVQTLLPQPIKVLVLSDEGDPVPNYAVRFSSEQTGAVLYPEVPETQPDGTADSVLTVLTDNQGVAQVFWQLGRRQGLQTLQVQAAGLKGSPIPFEATALSDDPFRLVAFGGSGQSAPVLAPLDDPFRVRVVDEYNNGVSDVDVRFVSRTLGGGFLPTGDLQLTVSTDSAGYADARYRLGTMAGMNAYHIQAEVTWNGNDLQNSPLDFYASGVAGPASKAVKIWSDSVSDTVGQILETPLKVKVTDTYGNAVSGFDVAFSVLDGDGLLDGQSNQIRSTDARGIAAATWQLGPVAGDSNNVARAVLQGLTPNQFLFKASAVADRADSLLLIGGQDQSGPMNTTLAQPLMVRVADTFGNPVKDHPVTFRVESESGSLNGASEKTVITNDNGLAWTQLSLESEVGDSVYQVSASAMEQGLPLQNSPILFFASAIYTEPEQLILLNGGSTLLGSANRELSDPLAVRVVDADYQPVPGIGVTFKVTGGGGYFAPDAGQVLTVRTDMDGEANARWVLGEANQNQTVRVTCTFAGTSLAGSPAYFEALAVETAAAEMIRVSPEDLSGEVGTLLEDSLVVRILDDLKLPVHNHPVQFTVESEEGVFTANGEQSLLVHTDPNGYARAQFVLGSLSGVDTYRVHASSLNPTGAPLHGSPVSFAISGLAGPASPTESTLSATSPIPSTGSAYSTLRVMLRDEYGNPVSGQQVALDADPSGLELSSASGITDKSGVFEAQASSVQVGTYTVRARIVETGQWLQASAEIEVFASTAESVQSETSNQRYAYFYSQLDTPLSVRVINPNGEGVSGYPVTFEANKDSVEILSTQPVYTDGSGIASVQVRCHEWPGNVTVKARTPGLTGSPVVFDVNISGPPVPQLTAMVSDTVQGRAGQSSATVVELRATDQDDRPIGNSRWDVVSADPEMATSDSAVVISRSDGLVRVPIRFGQQASETELILTHQGSSATHTLTLIIEPSDPEDLLRVSGNGQSGQAGDDLADPLRVQVVDAFNNGIAGVPVQFTIAQGGGSLIDSVPRSTDAEGHATMRVRLGTSTGKQTIIATSPVLPQRQVVFNATALSGRAYQISIKQGDQQVGVAGHRLNLPLSVRVSDEHGNPVANTAVVFTPENENGRVLPEAMSLSDSAGIASAHWILGANAGDQTLLAIHDGLLNSPLTFTATALPNNPPDISVESSYSGREQQPLSFTFSVTDEENDPFEVSVQNVPEGATVDSMRFNWTPTYDQAGDHVLTISAVDSAGARRSQDVTLTVENENRPPRIMLEESEPRNHMLGRVNVAERLEFYVKAEDDDNDTLRYVWRVNDDPRGASERFTLEGQMYPEGDLVVEALVFDPYDTVRTQWNLTLVTPVKLSLFQADFVPFEGVSLLWRTHQERHTLGFELSRAAHPDEPFEPVSPLIASNSSREYHYIDDSVPESVRRTLYYKLTAVDLDGQKSEQGVIRIDSQIPSEFKLYPNFPNPFNPQTTIRFALPVTGQVSMAIFDVLGKRVRTLANSRMNAGYHQLTWDGLNDQGATVASGSYYLIVQTSGHRESRRLILVR
jgi:lysophospholipase L1-like esterase